MYLKRVIRVFFLLSCLFSTLCFAKTLRVAYVDYPPHFNFLQNQKNSPLHIYVNDFLASAGFETVIVKLPGERAAVELDKGNIDLLLPVTKDSGKFDILQAPIFHSVPGLCFKKENFIPILSATHRFKGLTVGVPSGVSVVSALDNSGARLIEVTGSDVTKRGIDLTQRGRIDAYYHPSPQKIYHRENQQYSEVACSYFHGYSAPNFIALSKKLSNDTQRTIRAAFKNQMKQQTYELFIANQDY